MNPHQRHLMAGPRLPPVTIWAWRLVLVLLTINWLFDFAFLVILVPPLVGDPLASRTLLKRIDAAWFRAFLKSRTNLWGLVPFLSMCVALALAMNVIVTPAIWVAFNRRNATMYSAIAYWRIFLVSAALATDLAAINDKFPGVFLDKSVVSVTHLVAYDAYLAIIVFLMLLIAPQKSSLAANLSLAPSSQSLHSYATLAAASDNALHLSDVQRKAHRDLPPKAGSRLYANHIVSVTELDKVFAHEPLAHQPAAAGDTAAAYARAAIPTMIATATVPETDQPWIAHHLPLPPSPPPSLPRPGPGTLSSCCPRSAADSDESASTQALDVALADASCFPSYLTLPLDYAVRGHVLRKGQSILYVAVNGEPRPSFAKV